MSAQPTKRGAYHHGDLRAALLEAGEAVLAEAGVGGFSLRQVARKVGVSHAAPGPSLWRYQGTAAGTGSGRFSTLSGRDAAPARPGAY